MNLKQKIATLMASGIFAVPITAEAAEPSALYRVMHTDVGALMKNKLSKVYFESNDQNSKREDRKTPYGRIRGFGSMGTIGIPQLQRRKKKVRTFKPLFNRDMRYKPFCMDEVFDEFEPLVEKGCNAIQQQNSKTIKYDVSKCVEQVQDRCIDNLNGGKPKQVAKNYANCISAELSRQSLSTGTNANVKMAPGSSFHNMERYCRLK